MKSTMTYRSLNNQAYWPLPVGRSQENRLPNTAQPSMPKKLMARLSSGLKTLASPIIRQMTGSCEPYVWETKDATGHMVWNAQDPISGRTIRSVSETEIRIWLEERYQF